VVDEAEKFDLKVRVWRGDADGGYQTYVAPARGGQTVLDIVTWIQRNLDASLAYRFACRVGMCGSCAMTVNGKPRWTCRTRIGTIVDGGGVAKLTLAPLKNFPVIKDLVTDMAPFFDKLARAGGYFTPGDTPPGTMARVDPAGKARQLASAAIECIGCGICYAACDTVAWRADYLGPAALNRAWTLVNDERDGDRAGHLRAAAGEAGCHACHSHQSCAELCPKSLNPTASISGLKRHAFAAALKGTL
jgi:fumarate reductase iron-sulfur subunit